MDRVRVAARAAIGVLGFYVLRTLVSGVVTTVSVLTPAFPPGTEYVTSGLAELWPALLLGLFDSAVPYALGVFLVFWLVAPIRSDLRVGQVLVRGALGALGGAIVVALVFVAVSLGNRTSPITGFGLDELTPLAPNPIDVVVDALGSAVGTAPIVMLAALLSWGWPRWRSPSAPKPSAADPVVHWEIIGRAPAALRSFYERVFDWEPDTDSAVAAAISDAGDYGFVTAPEASGSIPGGIGGGPRFAPHSLFYIGVDDVGEALSRVRDAGGSVVLEPVARPDGQLVVAQFTDPEGNLVGLAGPR